MPWYNQHQRRHCNYEIMRQINLFCKLLSYIYMWTINRYPLILTTKCDKLHSVIAAKRTLVSVIHPGQFQKFSYKWLSLTKPRKIIPNDSRGRAGVHWFKKKKNRSHLEIPCARRVIRSQFDAGDPLKPIPHCRPTNIRRHRTKFSRPGRPCAWDLYTPDSASVTKTMTIIFDRRRFS